MRRRAKRRFDVHLAIAHIWSAIYSLRHELRERMEECEHEVDKKFRQGGLMHIRALRAVVEKHDMAAKAPPRSPKPKPRKRK